MYKRHELIIGYLLKQNFYKYMIQIFWKILKTKYENGRIIKITQS